jgi:hypothetical protein
MSNIDFTPTAYTVTTPGNGARGRYEGENWKYAIEGAKEAPVVLSRHVSRALRRRLHVFDGGESSERKTQVLKLRTRGGAIVAE